MFLKLASALAVTTAMGAAKAQTTPIKFQLDWRFEGPSALFLTPVAKGYFKETKLDVTVDAGSGSGAAVNRVASVVQRDGFAVHTGLDVIEMPIRLANRHHGGQGIGEPGV